MPRTPSRLQLTVSTALVAITVLIAGGGEPPPTIAGGEKVRADVQTALAHDSTVRVIVTLREPPALGTVPFDITAVRSQVAASQASVLSRIDPADFTISRRYQAVPALAGTVSRKGLAALDRHPDVVEIALDGVGYAATAQSAPLIHADEVQTAGLTGAGVIVAVLDSGIDSDHPDLAGDIAYEVCFLVSASCPGGAHPGEDNHGHGTNVSGIITGDGNVAPRGIAPAAQIAVYKVLDAGGSGFFSDWLAALDDIIANHPEVDIVNMSLQSAASCPAGGLGVAVQTLRDRGVPTFIAAGNHGQKDAFTVPACVLPGIIVGAVYDSSLGTVSGWKVACSDTTTAADDVACWSDSHDTLDLLAPGSAITAAGVGGGTSTFSGTSQASPHAAAVAALMLEADPGLTADDIEARLKATGTLLTDDLNDTDPGTNRTTARIDARAALITPALDYDGDGCLSGAELSDDPARGGGRNPLNPYDFFDTNGDGAVNLLDDVLAVVAAFGPSSGPAYDPALDRSAPPPGAGPLQLGPPDGLIDVSDILAVAAQFGHTCTGAP